MPLAVQRLRLPDTGRVSYTLLGDDGLPVGPAEAYLAHSPHPSPTRTRTTRPPTPGDLSGAR